jgi:IMP dehydrogenase
MKKAICFDDVLLVPQRSMIKSRSEIDISSTLDDKICLDIPIISSPMDTVSESRMAAAMSSCGGVSIIHRYNSIDVQCRHVGSMPADSLVGAAIGVTGDYLDRATALYDSGISILCVDIAHGHHALMKRALSCLREIFGDGVHIMAGNVATLDGFNDLADWGADSIRVGIGGGSICSTRVQTGHGIPTLESVLRCARTDRDAKLIADGGLRTSGDIVKALGAGADFVMLGSMLAGMEESPGEMVMVNGEARKVYRGMASKGAQIDWRGHVASVEGVSSTVPYRGPVTQKIQEIVTGIRSGLSYSGAKNLVEFRAKAQFIEQTITAATEGLAHINLR